MAFMAPIFGAIGGGAAAGSTAANIMAVGGTVLSAAGALQQHQASRAQAAQMEAAARANQAQLDYQAKQELASSAKQASAQRRKAELMMSRALAVASASGAGTSGIEGLLAGIAGEGEQAAQFEMYEGAERAKGLQYRGRVGVSQARREARTTRSQAGATLLGSLYSSGTSLWDRFGDRR